MQQKICRIYAENRVSQLPKVSNWEQGANCPTIDILFKVCEVLNVSINDIYGVYPDAKIRLSYDEIEHIRRYQNLDDFGKETVNITLSRESERVSALNRQKDRIKELESAKAPIIELQPHLEVNAAHTRTDIDIPKDADTSEDDIMDEDNF